jgi:hypothetical protein
VEALLETQCGECHGTVAARQGTSQGGLDGIGSADVLIRGRWIVPCAPSRLLESIESGRMPPPDATGPRPSAEDVATLNAFIAARAPGLEAVGAAFGDLGSLGVHV